MTLRGSAAGLYHQIFKIMTTQISTEVLIIGSGVAGAMCAYSLAQKGIKVTILEAGPRIKRDEIVNGFKQSPYLDLSAGYPNVV